MITTDKLLIELFQSGIGRLDSKIPARDKKILSSLSRQLASGHFLTENQAKLLVKIFKENVEHLKSVIDDKILLIESPTWSEPFRVIEQLRKISIKKGEEHQILVEFTYNKRLRQLMVDLNKSIEGQVSSVSGKTYSLPLTEKNVHIVVKTLKPFNFAIEPTLLNFFQEISGIVEKQEDVFDIFKIEDEKITSAVKSDIGELTEENLLLLNDRRFRYQYQIFPKNPENSLKNSIAQRPSTKIWIDSKLVGLGQLVSTLIDLKRLPVLFVFNGHEAKESVENLKKMAVSLEENKVDTGIGIYFRFDNSTPTNKEFNNLIAQFKYNDHLSQSTNVVGISNNKLPKFMLNSDWRPSSVISFSNNFKNNKTSLYCDDVDLIIYYNDRQPLGDIDVIV